MDTDSTSTGEKGTVVKRVSEVHTRRVRVTVTDVVIVRSTDCVAVIVTLTVDVFCHVLLRVALVTIDVVNVMVSVGVGGGVIVDVAVRVGVRVGGGVYVSLKVMPRVTVATRLTVLVEVKESVNPVTLC